MGRHGVRSLAGLSTEADLGYEDCKAVYSSYPRFAGLGLGATPVAIANMNAVTQQYGPSTKAFLVVPLVGAFFIDLLNAGTINFFIQLIQDYLV